MPILFAFLKKFWIKLSRRLKKYMPEISQNVQKVYYQRAERKKRKKFLNVVGH